MRRVRSLLLWLPILLTTALTFNACTGGAPTPGPGAGPGSAPGPAPKPPTPPKPLTPEEIERIEQTDRDTKFPIFRECHAKIQTQAQNIDEIVRNSVKGRNCLSDTQMGNLQRTVNELFTSLDSFAIAYKDAPQSNISEAFFNAANKHIGEVLSTYEDIQATFSYCRTQSILNGAQASDELKGSMGDNLFLVALGDIFGEGTGFEGNYSRVTLGHRLHALTLIQKHMKGLTFIKDEDQAHPCRGMNISATKDAGPPHPDISEAILAKLVKQNQDALTLLTAFEGSLENLQAEIKKQLDTLKKSESLFLPFSWSKHAFAFEITRETDNTNPTYTFRIYNSGEGIGTYHASSESGYNTQFFPHLEIINVPHKNLVSFVLLKALQEVTHPSAKNSKPENLYEQVVQNLGGKANPKGYDIDEFKDPQFSGTCSYFSLPWVLDSSIDKITNNDKLSKNSIAPRIEYLIGAITLKGYADIQKQNGMENLPEQNLHLLKKGLNFLSAQSLQSSVDGALDYGDLNMLVDIGERIRADLTVADATIRSTFYKSTVAGISADKIVLDPHGGSTSTHKHAEIDKSQGSVSGHSIFFDFKNWTLPTSSASLIDQLKLIVQDFENAQADAHFVAVVAGISGLALRLPLKQDPVWANMTDPQAFQLIQLMRRLETIYVFSLTQAMAREQIKDKQFSTKDFLVALKLLAVSDFLNKEYVTSLRPALPSMNQGHFSWVLSDNSALAEVKDVAWVKELELIRAHFKVPAQSFFGLDQIPAGVFFNSDRRIFHDEGAPREIPDSSKYWTDEVKWPDFEWTLKFMKQQPGFEAWRQTERTRTESKYFIQADYVAPFTWLFSESFDAALNPGVLAPSPVSRVDAEYLRRAALSLLDGYENEPGAKSFPDQNHLPSVFYDLRIQSFLTDFLLTGQLDVNSVKTLDYNKGVAFRQARTKVSYLKNTGRKFDVVEEHDELECIYKNAQGFCEKWGYVRRRTTKKIDLLVKTEYKASVLTFELFGGQKASRFYEAEQQSKEKKEGDIELIYTRPHFHPQGGFEPFSFSQADFEPGTDFHHDELMRIYMTGVKDKEGKPILDPLIEQERRRILPNDLIIKDPAKDGLKKLTLERIRSIFTLSGNRDLQLTETLALFDKFPSLLLRPEYQRLFIKLMFDPGLLENEFKISVGETERFLRRLVTFCEEHYNIFERRHSLKAMAFILQMNQLFKDQWDYAKSLPSTKRPPGFEPDFYDTPEKLFEIALGLPKDQLQKKSYIYRNIIEAYSNTNDFSERDVTLLLFAGIQHKTFAITEANWDDPYIESQVRHLLAYKQLSIRKVMLKDKDTLNDAGQRILAQVAGLVRPDLSLSSQFAVLSLQKGGYFYNLIFAGWSQAIASPSVFEASANGPSGATKIQIDVNSGAFFDAGKSSTPFPLSVSEYTALFGDEAHPDDVTQIGYQTYEWTGGSGRAYRIRKDATAGVWTYQMRYDGKWYQFVPDRQITFDVQGFFSGFDHWQTVGDSKTQTFLVIDRTTKAIAYRTVAECVDDTIKDCTVQSTTRERDKATLAFIDEKNYPKSVLAQIELPVYIYVWLGNARTRTIREVQLPRLGLSFRPLADDPTHLDCAGIQANTREVYKIADAQYSSLLHNPINYLVCDQAHAATSPLRLAISPIEPFEVLKKTTTLQATQFRPIRKDTEVSTTAMAPSVYGLAVYQLPALDHGVEAQGNIVPVSDAARLYLALRQLWQLEYREAKQNIDEVTRSDRKFSQEKGELRLIEWLLAGREDADPRATAVRVLAGINLLKQNRYFGATMSDDKIAILGKLYSESYLPKIRSLASDWIPFFDEYLLANAVSSGWFAANNRLAVLKAEYPRSALESPKSFEATTAPPEYQGKVIFGNPLEKLSAVNDKIYESAGTQGGMSTVRDAGAIIVPANFDILYDIARGTNYNAYSAQSLLKRLVGEVSIEHLSKEDLRDEWLKVFRLNVDTAEPASELARFLTLVGNLSDRSNVPSAAEIRSGVAELLRLDQRIANLNNAIKKKQRQIDALKAPDYYMWITNRVGQKEMIKDPNYEVNERIYEAEKQRLEREKQTLEAELSQVYEQRRKINESFDSRIFAKVSNERIAPIVFAPTMTKGTKTQPVRQPIKISQNKAGPEYSLGFDLSATNAIDPLKEPLLAADSKVFVAIPLSTEEIQTIRDNVESLKLELEKGHNGPAQVVAGIEELKNNLTKYGDTLIAQSTRSKLVDKAAIPGLVKNISAQIEKERSNKDALVKKALELSRQQSAMFSQSSYQRLLRFADAHDDKAIEELAQLLATPRLVEIYDATQGRLDVAQIKELKTTLFKMLLSSTYIIQASIYLKDLKSLNTLIARSESEDSEVFQSAINAVVSSGSQKRAYVAASHVEYLMLEQYMNFLMRSDQVASLDELDIRDGIVGNTKALGAVLEMIMGSGKTAVLLPLLSILNSKDEWLNIVMLPEALVASMAKQLALQIAKGFGRAVDVIEINRSTPLAEGDLKLLYDRLIRAQVEHRTLVTTNSSIQSLFLSYIAALHELSKGNKDYEQPIVQFVKIFQFLRSRGRLTIDEVDLALDILQSHQFSIKPRIPLNETLTNTVFTFYRFLASHDLGLRLPFIHASKGEPLTSSSYNKAKAKLIEMIARDGQLFNDIKGLDKTYRYYVNEPRRQELLVKYFNSNKLSDRAALFSDIDTTLARRGKADIDAMKNMAAVLYEEINGVFFLTAGHKLSIRYGKMPEPVQDKNNDESDADFAKRVAEYRQSKFLAIPYHAGNAVVTSRFGTAIEALNYTMQMQLEQKDYGQQIQLEVAALKKLADRNDERSLKLFTTRFDALRKREKTSISDVDKSTLDGWAKRLAAGGEPDLEFVLIHSYVLPQVRAYKTQLQTNAQIYEALFFSVQGFTGTLWSFDTFPSVFRKPLLSDTAEKTFFLLWSEHQKRKKADPAYKAVQALDKGRLMQDFDWAFNGSQIDDGGLFRGVDNEVIARRMVKDSRKSVVYYDKENNIVVLNTAETTAPIEEPQVPQSDRNAYWDKKHTTGSDLKLHAGMQARLSFDYHTLSRDFQQSAWRLRGLDKAQTINKYLVLKDDLDVIKQRMVDVLRLGSVSEFDLGDLILYTVMNQDLRLSDLLYRAVKQKMKNVIIHEVLDQMFSSKFLPNALVQLYEGVRELFEKNLADNPYTYAGFPKSEENKDVVLQRERANILNGSISNALKDARFYPANAHTSLGTKVDKIIERDRGKLPPTIIFSAIDEGIEVEIEMEMEQENEEEQEAEREVQLFEFDPNFTPHDILMWPYRDTKDIFKQGYFAPIPQAQLKINSNQWLATGQFRPLVRLNDALQHQGRDWLGLNVKPDLFVSLNFAPLHYQQQFGKIGDMHYKFDFFNLYHKNLTNLLVTMDSQKNTQIVLIDNNDASQFNDLLNRDHQLGISSNHRDLRVALYSLEQGIFRTGAAPIQKTDLEHNQQFIETLTQAKFLNGEIDYTSEESAFLRTWIHQNGVERMYLLFTTDILKYKQDSRESLIHSTIGRLFDELRTEN